MKGTVLGLDLGVTSVGWALIEAEFDGELQVGENEILATGVRIFESGMDMSKGLVSRNVERRQARAARRLHQRRRRRKQRLRRELLRAGLLPEGTEQYESLLACDPYELRARALDEELDPCELGRAFLHLGQRRGFKSNRKSARDAEHGKLLQEITLLEEEMRINGARTVGEYLAELKRLNAAESQTGDFRLRKRHTARSMYEHEFDVIWSSQSRWHGDRLDEITKERIRAALFDQRSFEVTPERRAKVLEYAKRANRARGRSEEIGVRRANLWRAPEIGTCELEPDEPRCGKFDWVAQRFRILKEVNNLRVLPADGSAERKLTETERRIVIDQLSTNREQKFEQLRKKLKLEGTKFNLESGGRLALGGNTVEAAIAGAFKKAVWQKKPKEERDRILRLVLDEPDEFVLIEKLTLEEGLHDEKATKLAMLQTGGGVVHLSKKAMSRMIPHLEEGADEYEAMVACGYVREDETSQVDKLPPTPDLPNPLVRRALVETRKVVNAIVRQYGLPTRIVVEMARDMTLVGKRLDRHLRDMRERERERDEARQWIRTERGIDHPTRNDINRYLLWKEQAGICPYSGRSIGQGQVFSREFEVDHILPRWRSLDDSFQNKVLCLASANMEKGNRTPFEWLNGTPRFEALKQHLARTTMHPRKRQRFTQEELDENEVPSRLLNDTRYMTREAVKYLNQLYPPKRRIGELAVGSSRGIMSAKLRHAWGIEGLVGSGDGTSKVRDDHRHHAVDALVTALTTRSRIKHFADYWRRMQPDSVPAGDLPIRFSIPWDGFREDVVQSVQSILVSHRPARKLDGPLHEATYYGGTEIDGEYVYTVPIDRLTAPQVSRIRNDATRRLIEERLTACGWSGGKEALPKGWFDEPLRFPDGHRVRKVRVLKALGNTMPFVRPDEEEPFRFARLGGNHHLEVIRKEGTSGPDGLRFEAVSRWEASRRVRRLGLSPVREDHGDGWRTEMVLHAGDSVLIHDPESGEGRLCVVQKISAVPNLYLVLRLHSDARPGSEVAKSPAARIVSAPAWCRANVRRVEITPLGVLSAKS